MYTEFFGLDEKPFAITPDPRYLYLSRRHADALAHLIYGISESGGFIQLTGEVGTGKTTLIRSLLEQLPEKAEIALILNPQLSAREFLEGICEELGMPVPDNGTIRALIGTLNKHLLKAHAEGRRIVLIVDEAQTLSPELLEQVRLLTNLETPTQKLLQIILIGQPELRDLLKRPEMRQIAQRITGRYHLEPLTKTETAAYVSHRMRVAGCQAQVFTRAAVTELYRRSAGIPRLINVVADRALLAAYTQDSTRVDGMLVRRAAAEVFGKRIAHYWPWAVAAAGIAAIVFGSVDLWRETRQASASAMSFAAAPAGDPGSAAAARVEVASRQTGTSRGSGPAPPTEEVSMVPAASAAMPASTDAAAELFAERMPAPRASTPPTLDQVLGDASVRTDTDSAFADLFALWGASYDADRGEPCVQAEEQRLRCLFQPSGSIGQLRALDLPAILTLMDPDGGHHDVVLTGLGYDTAEFSADGVAFEAGLSELTHYWLGEHLLLWRPPAENPTTLAAGMRSPEVVWLRRSLAQIRGEQVDGLSPVYDASLEEKVRQYQRDKLLAVDGIVGSMTQLALMTDLGIPGAPTLGSAR